MILSIKKLMFRMTILIPISVVFYIYCFPIQIYIGEIRLSLWEQILPLFFLLFTMLWLCAFPVRSACQKGDWFELLFNLFPVELLLFMVFAQWHFLAAILIFVALVGTIAFFAAAIFKQEDDRELSEKERRLNWVIFIRLFVLISFVFFIVPSILSVFVYDMKDPYYEARQDLLQQLREETGDEADGDIYHKHQRLLSSFRAENWETLSVEERITLLQALANMESEKLGIPPAKVITEKLEPYISGQHSTTENMIWIDIEHIQDDSLNEILNTCLHETYHAYQAYVVNHVDWDTEFSNSAFFDEARSWKENQSNYIRGYIDFDAYEQQPLEASARQFAEDETAAIFAFLTASD